MNSPHATIVPRAHQRDALDAVSAAVSDGQRRTTLCLAPGAGKTLLGRWIADRLNSRTTLVVVPSLALVAQTIDEWAGAGIPFRSFITCSDPSTAEGRAEISDGGGAVDAAALARHNTPVSTDPARLATWFTHPTDGAQTVVLSTYHSLPVVAQACDIAGSGFEVMIADEAHHLAGNVSAAFRTALDDTVLPVGVRVFMTATPVSLSDADLVSMDDPDLFGPIVYRLGFAEAIRQDLLTDFRVIVYQAPGSATVPDPVGALMVAAPEGLSRILTFHGRVAKARAFAHAVDGTQLSDGRTVRAYTVSADDDAATRARILGHLTCCSDSEVVVVSSAQCLAEGVNIPAVDAVLFADPKSSEVSAVQAVGRALRRSPGKNVGLVLLPVCVPDTLDVDTALSATRYRQVWKTLRALRTLDDSIVSDLRSAADGVQRGRRCSAAAGRVEFRVPQPAELAQLAVRAVDFGFRDWEQFFGELVAFADIRGHANPGRGSRLGEWAERQRSLQRTGMLDPAKYSKLSSLPGWVWDLRKHKWRQQLLEVRSATSSPQDVHNPAIMEIALHQPSSREGITTVGHWLAAQRIGVRARTLQDWQHALLTNTPVWRKQEITGRDAQGLDLLGEYVAWKKHANPPHGCVEDDFPLGKWVNQVRRAKVTGRLPLPLLHELEVLTPRHGSGRFQWCATNVKWMLSLEALHQFVTREGHCRIPYEHHEELSDITIPLYVWARNCRHFRRAGTLAAHRVALLEQVPGWVWEIPAPAHVRADIPADRHGTRAGYAAGCKCEECCAANLADHRRRTRLASAGLPTTDLVDADAARRHIGLLLNNGAAMKGIARATRLNVKTLNNIHSGDTRRILPGTERIVRRTTPAMVRDHGQPGSRVDATATWQLLDDMVARGWPKSWIARELGLGGSIQLKRTTVTQDNARKVADLDRRLGRRTPPARTARTPLPPLEQILADHGADGGRRRPEQVA